MESMVAQQLYADGTCLDRFSCGGLYAGRALCSDGKVRAVRFPRGGHADTFFSVPAVTTVKGKTVTGFVSVSSRDGFDTPTEDDPAVVKFTAYTYGRNGDLLP
jgi:hypothetical protein